jgi:hypothetical protein
MSRLFSRPNCSKGFVPGQGQADWPRRRLNGEVDRAGAILQSIDGG